MTQPMINIHNKFHVVVTNSSTNEIVQEAFAENLVLDRIYGQLLEFKPYFTNIVFGSGPTVPTPLAATRDELFNRIGYKAANNVEVIRAYPLSSWTRSIRLGTSEFNNNEIAEVGISETTTKINTHAMLKDADGKLISIIKNATTFIDIYCTVYVSVYSVDSGLFWYSNELRDYLTGGSQPTNNLAISYLNDPSVIAGERTYNLGTKKVTLSGIFGEEHLNEEVKYIDWQGIGLRCVLPRTGVWEGIQKTGVSLGVANGVLDTFTIPQYNISNLVIKVGGVVSNDWARKFPEYNVIKFNSAPVSGDITADYFCTYIPKDMLHALSVSMSINFAVSEPSLVMPNPTMPVSLPKGTIENTEVGMIGNYMQGFYGEVSSASLISGNNLASYLNLTSGTTQNSDEGWLKVILDRQFMFIAKKTFRHSISWNNIDAVSAIYGKKYIVINNNIYAIKLLTSNEWDRIIQPLHKDGIEPRLYNYTDAELGVTSGNGRATWTSTPSGSPRVLRGSSSVGLSFSSPPSSSHDFCGWRPVLVYISTL